MLVGAMLGGHRRCPQGHPRRQRGRSRRSCSTRSPPASSPTCSQPAASADAERPATSTPPTPHARRPAGSPSIVRGDDRTTFYGFIVIAVARGRRRTGSCSSAPASASTCAPSGAIQSAAAASGVDAQAHDHHRDAHLRRDRRPRRHADRCSARPTTYQPRLPAAASASPASPSPCSAATTRSASRSRALLWALPGRGSRPARVRGLRQGDRRRSCRASSCCAVVIAYEVVRRLRPEPPAAQGRRASSPHQVTGIDENAGGGGDERHGDRHPRRPRQPEAPATRARIRPLLSRSSC